ncbi:hypothetical protein BMS3Abin05_00865 [bacterium BMS3Abin05]|nr:hypothetical protein BMS3Abin05_00865 [bacterium BMS3Abin05]GBE26654.1 hypothetical protein BMS3Bbin03_00569 [bacterium BMS3Bbin03]HDZ11775.1 hypothetical protein [Bacteroidota bacterium]
MRDLIKKYSLFLGLIFLFSASVLAQEMPGNRRYGRRHQEQRFSLQPKPHWESHPQGIIFFNTFGSNYLGFGGSYFFRPFLKNHRFGLTVNYIPLPADNFPGFQMYDPYYGGYVYIDREYRKTRSIYALFLNYRQEIFTRKFRYNFRPYVIGGVGPLLAYESVRGRGFLHGYTQLTAAGFAGLGLNYNLGNWFLNAGLHYSIIHFQSSIYNRKVMDSWTLQFGIGKYFRLKPGI